MTLKNTSFFMTSFTLFSLRGLSAPHFNEKSLPPGGGSGDDKLYDGSDLFYGYGDRSGQFAAIGTVKGIGKLEGQDVLARRKGYIGNRLRLAEVHVMFIFWHYGTCRNRVARIDQDMMVTRADCNGPSGRIQLHSIDTHFHFQRRF